jgi:uncharacterized membrane protein YhaH (DUF805 family)
MIKHLKNSLNNYANFKGRATRAEFWSFVAFLYIAAFFGGLIDGILATDFFGNLFVVSLLIPYFAVAFRRMHDVNKPGWFMFIPFYNVILACTQTKPEIATEKG